APSSSGRSSSSSACCTGGGPVGSGGGPADTCASGLASKVASHPGQRTCCPTNSGGTCRFWRHWGQATTVVMAVLSRRGLLIRSGRGMLGGVLFLHSLSVTTTEHKALRAV